MPKPRFTSRLVTKVSAKQLLALEDQIVISRQARHNQEAIVVASVVGAAREAAASSHIFQQHFDEYEFVNHDSSGVRSPYYCPNGTPVHEFTDISELE